MRYLVGFGLALGVVLSLGCGESGGSQCQFPLGDLCEGGDCSTWDQAVARAEEFVAAGCIDSDAYSGQCGDRRYIRVGGLTGRTEYFDDAGLLMATEYYSDAPDFCDGTSWNIFYGPISDCDVGSNILENFCKDALLRAVLRHDG